MLNSCYYSDGSVSDFSLWSICIIREFSEDSSPSTTWTKFSLGHKRWSRKRNRKKWEHSDSSDPDSVELITPLLFWLRFAIFTRSYSYDSDYDSNYDSIASEVRCLKQKLKSTVSVMTLQRTIPNWRRKSHGNEAAGSDLSGRRLEVSGFTGILMEKHVIIGRLQKGCKKVRRGVQLTYPPSLHQHGRGRETFMGGKNTHSFTWCDIRVEWGEMIK